MGKRLIEDSARINVYEVIKQHRIPKQYIIDKEEEQYV